MSPTTVVRDSMKESVLLIGNLAPSLAVARSLAAAGYRIIAGNGGEFDVMSHSRSCHEVWRHPPAIRADEFLDALAAFIGDRPDIAVIIPMQSRYVRLVALERHRMPQGPLLVTPAADVVLRCIDKVALYELAATVGVPTAAWGVAHDLDELVDVAGEVGLPCVVRPTADAAGPLADDRKAVICRDLDGLRAAFPRWPAEHPALLVQHEAPGVKQTVSFVAQQGHVRVSLRTRFPRTDRADGTGMAVESVSLPIDTGLVAHVEALAGALAYTGYGTAQFLVPHDAEPSLLEINPRLGNSVGWKRSYGLDLPRIAVEVARSERDWRPPADWVSPVGRRTVWTSRDLLGLRLAIHRGEVDGAEALRWLGRTIRAFAQADAHVTWDRRDPMPTLHVFAEVARAVVRPPDR